MRNPFGKIPEFFVGSHHFLDTNFTHLTFKLGLLSGKPNTGCFSGILSSLFSLFLYPVLQYTTEQVLTIFVKLHFYLKIKIIVGHASHVLNFIYLLVLRDDMKNVVFISTNYDGYIEGLYSSEKAVN